MSRFLRLAALSALLGACAFDPETGISVGGGGGPSATPSDAATVSDDAGVDYTSDASLLSPDASQPTPPPPPPDAEEEEEGGGHGGHRGPRGGD